MKSVFLLLLFLSSAFFRAEGWERRPRLDGGGGGGGRRRFPWVKRRDGGGRRFRPERDASAAEASTAAAAVPPPPARPKPRDDRWTRFQNRALRRDGGGGGARRALPSPVADALSAVRTVFSAVRSVLMYKPPVGVVGAYLTLRLLRAARGSGGRKIDRDLRKEEVKTGRRRRRRRNRTLDLDDSDSEYDLYGGVESVRAELCRAALRPIVEAEGKEFREAMVDLSVGNFTFVRRLSRAADAGRRSAARAARRVTSGAAARLGRGRRTAGDVPSPGPDAAPSPPVVVVVPTDGGGGAPLPCRSAASCATDALEVACRPRGSREAFVERSAEPLAALRSRSFPASNGAAVASDDDDDEGDEEETEADRLVRTAAAISTVRSVDALLRVLRDRLVSSSNRLKRAESRRRWRVRWYEGGIGFRGWLRGKLRRATLDDDRRELALSTAAYERERDRLGTVQGCLLSRPTGLGRGALIDAAARAGDDDNGDGDDAAAAAAASALLDDDGEWLKESERWTADARTLIRDVVADVVSDVAATTHDPPDEHSDLALLSEWADGTRDDDVDAWRTALRLVDDLARPPRVGELRLLSLRGLTNWAKLADFGGIPSSIVLLVGSFKLHDALAPRWPSFVDYGRKALSAVWGIVDMRFWRPARDIGLDLLNRRPRLLDPYALENEQTSLDFMLRDLGLGDGTKKGRPDAVAAASRLYEEELQRGPVKGLFRGKLVRLILIQIQQLKAGMLQAMGSIDDLVDKNRLNVQLLASIPAVLLVAVGSRIAFAFLYNLRAGTVRPRLQKEIRDDMNDCLRKIEWHLLRSGRDDDVEGGTTTSEAVLRAGELGEFVLLLHSFVLLLDYVTPPVPYRVARDVQRCLQELLAQGHMSKERQLKLLGVVKEKNRELLRSYF